MITRQFSFFSSLLGLIIMNGLAGSAVFFVTTSMILAMVWLVSGFRYVVYGAVIFIMLTLPNLIQLAYMSTAVTPPLYSSLLSVIHQTPVSPYIIQIASSPIVAFALEVFTLFNVAYGERKIAEVALRKIPLKRLSGKPQQSSAGDV